MIWLDNTKVSKSTHHSGLMRVSTQLQQSLGKAATGVAGPDWIKDSTPADWFLTAEIFTPEERLGFAELLQQRQAILSLLLVHHMPYLHHMKL